MSLLWERLNVFLSPSPHPSTRPAPAPPSPPPSSPPAARHRALEHALHAAGLSLSDERARTAKWERRALVATADQHLRTDHLAALTDQLAAAEKAARKFELLAHDATRAKRLAEEHRDVALQRLSVVPDRLDALNNHKLAAEKARDALADENRALKEELAATRRAIEKERANFVADLAQRTTNFSKLEEQLSDARETYITAATNFDKQRNAFADNLSAAYTARETACTDLKLTVQDNGQRLKHLADRCHELEEENANLRLKNLAAPDTSPRTSFSSLSSSASELAGVAKRVIELEASLETEARSAQELRKQVKKKETEATQLRGEMAAIHARMKRMSLPKGAEAMLGTEGDKKKLQQIRDLTRAQERKTRPTDRNASTVNKRLPAARRSKISEHKTVMKPWVRR